MENLVRGEFYTVYFNNMTGWADVEYIGKTRKGEYKMESCIYGDVYFISKDMSTINIHGKIFKIDTIC